MAIDNVILAPMSAQEVAPVAFNVKLSDDLLSKIRNSKSKLVVKNGELFFKLIHKDGSETIFESKLQEETTSINLYSQETDERFAMMASVRSRLSIFANGIKRSKSGSESKILVSSSASSSASPPSFTSSSHSSSKKPTKLVARSNLNSKSSPEVRLLHLMALGPNTIEGLCTRCRVPITDGENLIKRFGEVLTSTNVAYQEDVYADYSHLPPEFSPPTSEYDYYDSPDDYNKSVIFTIKDTSYQHLSVWQWKFRDNERESVLKNMKHAFDRLKFAADDPLRKLLIDPKIINQNLKDQKLLKEEKKRREFEEAQSRKEKLKLESAKQIEAKDLESRAKEKKSLKKTSSIQKFTKPNSRSSAEPSPSNKKSVSRSSSQTSKHPNIPLDFDEELIELGKGVPRPSVELTPTTKSSQTFGSLTNNHLKINSFRKSSSASPGTSIKKKRESSARNSPHPTSSSSDEDQDEFDEDEAYESLNQVHSLSSSAAASSMASAEYGNNSVRKRFRTVSSSSSGSMSSSSNYSSSSSRMGKHATGGRDNQGSSPSSGNATSPELDSSDSRKPAKKVITNVTSSSLDRLSTNTLDGSGSARLFELAQKFREKYKEYEELYLYIQKNKSKMKKEGYGTNSEYQDDVKRVIQLHNELTIWKKKLWSTEIAKNGHVETESRASHSRSPSGSLLFPTSPNKREGKFDVLSDRRVKQRKTQAPSSVSKTVPSLPQTPSLSSHVHSNSTGSARQLKSSPYGIATKSKPGAKKTSRLFK